MSKSGWNPRQFSDPYEAVSVADCFYKLSSLAKEFLGGIFEAEVGDNETRPKKTRMIDEAVDRVKGLGITRKDVEEAVDKEVKWFINEILNDAGEPKPVTRLEHRQHLTERKEREV